MFGFPLSLIYEKGVHMIIGIFSYHALRFCISVRKFDLTPDVRST